MNLLRCTVGEECVNCKEILQGNSPDVIEIDGASNNSVENIRNLRDSVQFLPTRGKENLHYR